jgi:RsiW-degrading membrane proteinase PrsW (M82 family)
LSTSLDSAGLLELYAGFAPMPKPVAAGRLWGICIALLVIVRHRGNVRGWVFAARSELERPKSELAGMAVVSALLRFVIILFLYRFVTPITQFLRKTARVLTYALPHPYFGV